MATSFGLKRFGRRMRVVSNLFGANFEKAFRQAVSRGVDTATVTTPLRSGRARANWFTSIGAPSSEMTEPGSPVGSAGQSIGRAAPVLAAWKIGSGPVFITNNVPYIEQLDNGSSAQAPAGMSAAAVLAASTVVSSAKLVPRS